jgi:NADH dehydrogenase [ubiquinone] 1 alpha subcomplex assembly factor 7
VTPLERHLRRRIALEGPLTLANYMADALGHPEHGYYTTRDPFGSAGDFTTAPEISQMFGELIGLWCADLWSRMGAPGRLLLVELGPGRGTLMADLMRAAGAMPGFAEAAEVHLVETSPVLRRAQAETLKDLPRPPRWLDGLAELPAGAPILLVANEFFDALPVRQFQRTARGWRERLVALDPQTDALSLTLAPGPSPAEALIDPVLREAAAEGAVAELAPAAWSVAGHLGDRLADQGGAALIADYGHAGPAAGDTLQAVRAHAPCSILETPGEADLTAHVDFTALAKAAAGGVGRRAAPLASQGDFLRALGIEIRAETLIRNAGSAAMADDIAAARDRLIGADTMGTLFKVLGLAAEATPPLAGLESA